MSLFWVPNCPLIAFQALIIARLDPGDYPNIQESTKAIVFLSTPHRGSDGTKWPKLLANILNVSIYQVTRSLGSTRSDLIKLLETNSDALLEIATNFQNRISGMKIISCYEVNTMLPLGILASTGHKKMFRFVADLIGRSWTSTLGLSMYQEKSLFQCRAVIMGQCVVLLARMTLAIRA